jgi:hypothetical protein
LGVRVGVADISLVCQVPEIIDSDTETMFGSAHRSWWETEVKRGEKIEDGMASTRVGLVVKTLQEGKVKWRGGRLLWSGPGGRRRCLQRRFRFGLAWPEL